jgi:hypothetical protein
MYWLHLLLLVLLYALYAALAIGAVLVLRWYVLKLIRREVARQYKKMLPLLQATSGESQKLSARVSALEAEFKRTKKQAAHVGPKLVLRTVHDKD